MKITNSNNVKVFLRLMVQPKTGETVAVSDIELNGADLVSPISGRNVMTTIKEHLENLLPIDVANEVFAEAKPAIAPLDRCRVQLPTMMPDDKDFVEFLSMNNIELSGRIGAGVALECVFEGTYDALRDMINDWWKSGDKTTDDEMLALIEKI